MTNKVIAGEKDILLNIPSLMSCYDWLDNLKKNKSNAAYINATQIYLLELAGIIKSAQIGGS